MIVLVTPRSFSTSSLEVARTKIEASAWLFFGVWRALLSYSNVFCTTLMGFLPVDTFLLTNEGTINVDSIDFLATSDVRVQGDQHLQMF